jgi:hypothetical protein
MLGSNPSADSVASTDRKRGDALPSPFFVYPQQAQHRERHQAINPGGAGAKPLQTPLASSALLLRATSHNACLV